MGLFDFLHGPNFSEGLDEYRETNGAILLDVRTPQEYCQGHIPKSVNVPLQDLGRVAAVVPNKETPLFVYCQSGSRSAQATAELQRAGYTSVKNIGGIGGYNGEVECA